MAAEDAVLVEFAVGERLGAVLEGVRERVGAGVGDLEFGVVSCASTKSTSLPTRCMEPLSTSPPTRRRLP